MKNKVYQKSITLGDLGKFTEKVILPGVERIVDKRIQPLEKQMDGFEKRMDGFEKRMGGLEVRMDGFEKRMGGFENELKLVRMEVRQSKNEILNSEDKIVGELKKARQEQAAMYLNYQKIEARVYKLETIVKILAEKLKIKIEDILPAE
ncbi:MAG: hypothetical protein UV02_C0068G0008 [Candidatus Kuenenbacteria bacterium GW2011_GWA2_42_15]|uniref:Uncharacterized protein n=1 Tax=Candidatus Kuenenbacteria bacterium GW2011_GWA2_42_15 TaxID=1618677 RepID=A0A0G0YSC3_9BACT|nr:MAG: hypothetical protein UV02_C0068G0008 [Candidatus Kuenenbacteria bacterium GW2011_GWA2_42_15]